MRILGYSMSDSMDTQMFINCLNRAKEARGRAVMADTFLSLTTTDLNIQVPLSAKTVVT